MKHFIVVTVSFVIILYSRAVQDDDDDATPNDYQINPTHQPVLNGGQIPLPGDIPVLNRKIFRGVRVTTQEHPYMASIRRRYTHFISGVIISRNLIITIAHPIYGVPINELGVVVGENYADRGRAIMTIVLVIVHNSFNQYKLTGDIALLRLYVNIIYRINVKPIFALVAPDVSHYNKKIFITGWGRCDVTGKEMCFPRSSLYFPGEKFDPMLKTIYVETRHKNNTRDPCAFLYKRNFEVTPDPYMLCLGYPRDEYPTAPCMASPGAAAVLDARLLGLQSWGFGCGFRNDLPIIYTDIRKYYRWILNTTKILHQINNVNLSQLYHVTVATEMYNYLSKTRVFIANDTHVEDDIQTLPVDEKLASIQGQVYDIRDFASEGKYKESKRRNYEILSLLSQRNEKLKIIQDVVNEELDVEPFLPRYIPSVESESDTDGDVTH